MKIYQGDCLEVLPTLPAGIVQTCVTSPPYYGLRDYGVDGQIGLEQTPDEYIARLVAVFREVRRVLKDDGTLWLNLGDSYGGKDLLMIPARVALALQADGWYLRSEIIWHKPNPMPESVKDRPTKAHEMIYLLAKSAKYYYDADAVREPHVSTPERYAREKERYKERGKYLAVTQGGKDTVFSNELNPLGRNRRDVWTVATRPYKGAHFATFPPALIEPCILAGSAAGDTVLDPFNGSGTTGAVAVTHGRDYIGIELNAEYIELAHQRIAQAQPRMIMENA